MLPARSNALERNHLQSRRLPRSDHLEQRRIVRRRRRQSPSIDGKPRTHTTQWRYPPGLCALWNSSRGEPGLLLEFDVLGPLEIDHSNPRQGEGMSQLALARRSEMDPIGFHPVCLDDSHVRHLPRDCHLGLTHLHPPRPNGLKVDQAGHPWNLGVSGKHPNIVDKAQESFVVMICILEIEGIVFPLHPNDSIDSPRPCPTIFFIGASPQVAHQVKHPATFSRRGRSPILREAGCRNGDLDDSNGIEGKRIQNGLGERILGSEMGSVNPEGPPNGSPRLFRTSRPRPDLGSRQGVRGILFLRPPHSSHVGLSDHQERMNSGNRCLPKKQA